MFKFYMHDNSLLITNSTA